MEMEELMASSLALWRYPERVIASSHAHVDLVQDEPFSTRLADLTSAAEDLAANEAESTSLKGPGFEPRGREPTLPIDEHREKIMQSIGANRVTCIQGETGCGKSSMVPQYILEDAQKRGKSVKVLVTQPRRLAAVTLARRVASQRGEETGRTVGYRIGQGDHVDSDETQVIGERCTLRASALALTRTGKRQSVHWY